MFESKMELLPQVEMGENYMKRSINLFPSSDVILMTKSVRLDGGHVARMGEVNDT